MDSFPTVLADVGCLPDEVISPSTLCLEAKKKTSLPLDIIQVNVSSPSSSASSDSGTNYTAKIWLQYRP